MESCLAVDIGGSKMEVAAVTEDGDILARQSAPTPVTGDAEEIFSVLSGLLSAVQAEDPAALVCGVGCGGPMHEGLVSPLNIPAWHRFPLRSRLSSHLGMETFVDNDAKALAMGEAWLGAARGSRNFIAMVVSTGVGGGIVLDGHLLDGAGGNAGHIGHVVVEPGGHTCTCGGRGCLEAEASGRAIEQMTGRPAAEAGPEVVTRTGRLVGRAVASVANLLDLRLALVAGSVALGFASPFFEAAANELDARARIDFARGARILPAGLGADGPVIGASAVGWRGLRGRQPARLA